MSLKKKLPLLFLASTFSIWLVSLLSICLTTGRWGTPTFPLVIDANVVKFFVISTIFSSLASLLVGVYELLSESALKGSVKQNLKLKKKPLIDQRS